MGELSFPMNTSDPLELINAMLDGNYHRGGLSCLRLWQLDADFFRDLRTEVEQLCEAQIPSNVADPKHITHWTRPLGQVLQYSLFNGTGRYDDFTSDHNLSIFGKRFYGANQYPVLGEFIAAFPHAINFRVNVLGIDAELAPHEEHLIVRAQTGTMGLRIRMHLPVVTNSAAELILEENVYHLDPGFVYFINHGCYHSALNHGDQPRIHLVWDLLFTRECFILLFDTDPNLPVPARRLPPTEQHVPSLRQQRMGPIRSMPAPFPEQDVRDLDFLEPQ
jgi:aspartyl/asparaginyl beta-hydroxylase